MAKVIIFGVLILFGFFGTIVSLVCAMKAQGSKPRKVASLFALFSVVLLVVSSVFEVKAVKAEQKRQEEQAKAAAAEAETAENQTVSQNDTEPASEDAGGEDAKGTEEPETEEPEEPDWESMDADYLSDKATMDNGAIRALEMTERDIHRFDEEYGRVISPSSSNDRMIYRISHAEDGYAFSNSILVNFGDRWYFEDHADDLEYLYAIDKDDIDPDGKVFVKARAEMLSLIHI